MIPPPSFFDLSPEELNGVDFDAELLDAVIDHWHNCLMSSGQRDSILSYLGLSLSLAAQFRVGVSDRTLGLRIPGRRWKAGLAIRTRLDELGVLRSSGHEAFRGCVVIPVTNAGAVSAIYAQRLERGRGDVWANGLPGAPLEVNCGGRAASSPALVTSSVPDALAVLGALESFEDSERPCTVLAPGRASGFSAKDMKKLSSQFPHVVVLGRDAGAIGGKLQRLGASVSLAGGDCDVARVITSAPEPSGVLRSLMSGASPLVGVAPTCADAKAFVGAVTPTVTSTIDRDEVFVRFASRSWRIRGAQARSNIEGDRLSVALSVSDVNSGRFHLDTIDLYTARSRATFLDVSMSELRADREVLSAEMAEVIGRAERHRDDALLEPANEVVPMTESERAMATAWLEDSCLLGHLIADLAQLGVVGEETNLLLCYLATISRKCERPLGVLVQSSSAGGKSTLVDAVASLVPSEDLVSLSAMTSQALYYLGGSGLAHKVLSVAEEHGALRASYALKLLLSEGRLAIASTGKDRASGRLMTKNYETTGPLALLMTTTATSIDPELENRLIVLGVNEDSEQTQAIIAAQRRSVSLEGLHARSARDELRREHANIQRLLEPLPVVIAEFESDFPASATRHRRDHAKLLSIISAITLLHQFQRERRTTVVAGEMVTYLEATKEDVDRGVALARRVLVRDAESLAPQTTRLLEVVRDYARSRALSSNREPSEVDVTRRELRELLGWSVTQIRSAIDRLVALEYLVVAGGGRGRCRTYRLVPELAEVGGLAVPITEPSSAGKSDELVGLVSFDNTRGSDKAVVTSYVKIEEVRQ